MNYIEEIQRILEQLSIDTNADFEQIKKISEATKLALLKLKGL